MDPKGIPLQINEDRLRETLRGLVDIYSPSGKEHEVVAYAAERLREAGLPVVLREVADGRCNVEAIPADRRPGPAFLGHLDTVPVFDVERYEYAESGDRICGLGTADMKSGCAAMMEAFMAAAEAGHACASDGLFLVVGEEETGDGSAALLEAHRPSTAIVGEPTDLQPCLSHFGYLEMGLRAFGTRRHASMAGRDHNAIDGMLRSLLILTERVEEEYPQVVLNIRDLHSSEAGFAVPDRCAAWLDLHLPPRSAPESVAARLHQIAREALDGNPVTRHEIEFPTKAQGYELSPDCELARSVRWAIESAGERWAPIAFRSHSDANLLFEAGCVPIILGPGQLARAHTRDESVEFSQVVRAAQLYARILSCDC